MLGTERCMAEDGWLSELRTEEVVEERSVNQAEELVREMGCQIMDGGRWLVEKKWRSASGGSDALTCLAREVDVPSRHCIPQLAQVECDAKH